MPGASLPSIRRNTRLRCSWGYHKVGGTGNAAFLNSCVHVGSPWEVAAYWKDPLGFVHLRGRVKSFTAVPVTIFTLPPGSRPANQESFVIVSNGAFGRSEERRV